MVYFMTAGEFDWWAEEHCTWCSSCAAEAKSLARSHEVKANIEEEEKAPCAKTLHKKAQERFSEELLGSGSQDTHRNGYIVCFWCLPCQKCHGGWHFIVITPLSTSGGTLQIWIHQHLSPQIREQISFSSSPPLSLSLSGLRDFFCPCGVWEAVR